MFFEEPKILSVQSKNDSGLLENGQLQVNAKLNVKPYNHQTTLAKIKSSIFTNQRKSSQTPLNYSLQTSPIFLNPFNMGS